MPVYSYCAFVSSLLVYAHFIGDVALGDVVFLVRRCFTIHSLSTLCANSFVYHLSLQQCARGAFYWQE